MSAWSAGFTERNRVETVRLADLTTLRVGGTAGRVTLDCLDDLPELLAARPRWLGRGANLLVGDGDLGLVAQLGPAFAELSSRGEGERSRVTVGGACDLSRLVASCARAGQAGPDGLAGVPASIGGALAMNAGTAEVWLFDLVDRVQVFLPGASAPIWLERAAVPAAYRHNGLPPGTVFLGCELLLASDDPQRLQERASRLKQRKAATQPLTQRSAGCIFKNPSPELPAGMLVDQLGCKGESVGAAMVSDIHANFIVNRGGATAQDVCTLIERIRQRAWGERGVVLELEVQTWDCPEDLRRHPAALEQGGRHHA